jgi:hypothetical protein
MFQFEMRSLTATAHFTSTGDQSTNSRLQEVFALQGLIGSLVYHQYQFRPFKPCRATYWSQTVATKVARSHLAGCFQINEFKGPPLILAHRRAPAGAGGKRRFGAAGQLKHVAPLRLDVPPADTRDPNGCDENADNSGSFFVNLKRAPSSNHILFMISLVPLLLKPRLFHTWDTFRTRQLTFCVQVVFKLRP